MGEKGAKVILKPGEVLVIIGENQNSFNEYEQDPAFTRFLTPEQALRATELPERTRFIILGKFKRTDELVRHIRGLALGVTIHYSKNQKDSRALAQDILAHAVRQSEEQNPPSGAADGATGPPQPPERGPNPDTLGDPVNPGPPPDPPEDHRPDGPGPVDERGVRGGQRAKHGQLKGFVEAHAHLVAELSAMKGGHKLLSLAQQAGIATTEGSLIGALTRYRKDRQGPAGVEKPGGPVLVAVSAQSGSLASRVEFLAKEILSAAEAENQKTRQELEQARLENRRLARENADLSRQLAAIQRVLESKKKPARAVAANAQGA